MISKEVQLKEVSRARVGSLVVMKEGSTSFSRTFYKVTKVNKRGIFGRRWINPNSFVFLMFL